MRSLAVAVLMLCCIATVPVRVAGANNVTLNVTPMLVLPTIDAIGTSNISATSAVLVANITNTGGVNVTCRGFEWGLASANYTWTWNQTGSFQVGTFSRKIEGLSPQTEYFWRAFAVNSLGQANSTEMNFWSSGTLPSPPKDFRIKQIGLSAINVTWTLGVAATGTEIWASWDDYPSRGEGWLVYNGTGTCVEDSDIELAERLYLSAWSWNDLGYSVICTQAYIGGNMAATIIAYISNLLEGPMGITSILFILGMVGFAFWKKGWIRVVLSLGIIAWGAFAFDYDIKVAGPLLGIGVMLFVMGILNLIANYRESKTEI